MTLLCTLCCLQIRSYLCNLTWVWVQRRWETAPTRPLPFFSSSFPVLQWQYPPKECFGENSIGAFFLKSTHFLPQELHSPSYVKSTQCKRAVLPPSSLPLALGLVFCSTLSICWASCQPINFCTLSLRSFTYPDRAQSTLQRRQSLL